MWIWTFIAASCWPCWGPTGPASPPRSRSSPRCSRPMREASRSAASSCRAKPSKPARCHRVAIMDRGKVVALGSPADLVRQAGVTTALILTIAGNAAAGLEAVRKLPDVADAAAADGRLRVATAAGSQLLPDVIRALL